jgi:hypothetical protein
MRGCKIRASIFHATAAAAAPYEAISETREPGVAYTERPSAMIRNPGRRIVLAIRRAEAQLAIAAFVRLTLALAMDSLVAHRVPAVQPTRAGFRPDDAEGWKKSQKAGASD